LSKGGRFYKAEDINKIWGLRPDEIKRLLPYVRIEQKKTEYAQTNVQARQTSYIPKTIQLDINTADTTAFIALPGIGSKLAQRIINFRDKLGGFNSIEQVSETFGLPDSTFQKIKNRLVLTDIMVKKININTALLDDMKTHPYIRYHLANAIVQYRTQHGNFLSIPDLKKIMTVTADAYKKMEPYVTIQ
jgi:competence ComEA-like helix-hairpin-helix protein